MASDESPTGYHPVHIASFGKASKGGEVTISHPDKDDEHLAEVALEAGGDLAGAASGAAIGLLLGGPPGAIAGAVAGPVVKTTLVESMRRILSRRERVRV